MGITQVNHYAWPIENTKSLLYDNLEGMVSQSSSLHAQIKFHTIGLLYVIQNVGQCTSHFIDVGRDVFYVLSIGKLLTIVFDKPISKPNRGKLVGTPNINGQELGLFSYMKEYCFKMAILDPMSHAKLVFS